MIVVNFKTYEQATGAKAVSLATLCKQVADATGIRIVVVPQLADLKACAAVGIECWAQHIDSVEPGKHTGSILLEDVLAAGAKGTLLNHSEHKLDWDVLKDILVRLDNRLDVCVCASDLAECKRIGMLRPKYVAYEPAELIGSTEVSVASEKGETVQQVVEALVGIPVLIGAGIHSPEDITAGLGFGAVGVLLATDVVLATDPKKELLELAQAFKA